MLDVAALCERLAELVRFDTQNPTGNERPMIEKLAADLKAVGAAAVETFEAGESPGHHAVYARFGEAPARLLVNAHIDTVPANSGYSEPPLELYERDGRLFGLGTADTKGAIAAILEALGEVTRAGRRPSGVAVLFSGDEEKGTSCVRAFLASGRAAGLERVIVCEPTGCRVGTRHRGIAAAEAHTTSPGGHSSRADEVPSPIVAMAKIAVALDELGQRRRAEGPAGFQGICLNVAAIDGGVAFNVIPSEATLVVSVRPAPGVDVRTVLGEAEREARRAAEPEEIAWRVTLANPSFATKAPALFVPLLGDRARDPIDLAFWTEAALFAEKGIDAVIFGPGSIEQAHAADEFVTIAELEEATRTFVRVFS